MDLDLSTEEDSDSERNVEKLQEQVSMLKHNLAAIEKKKNWLKKELTETENCNSMDTQKNSDGVSKDFEKILESELQCCICNELFIVAITLDCGHTFCKYCINEWKKVNGGCPVCRAKITNEHRSIFLDNFIDKMVEHLSDDIKRKRRELTLERATAEASRSSGDHRHRRRRARHFGRNDYAEHLSPGSSAAMLLGSRYDEARSSQFPGSGLSLQVSVSFSDLSSDDSLSMADSYPDLLLSSSSAEDLVSDHFCCICGRRGHRWSDCPDSP